MLDSIKKQFHTTSLYNLYQPIRDKSLYRKWLARNKAGLTPQRAKHLALLEIASQFHLNVFIETGTCYGDTIYALHKWFERVYSIELNGALFSIAQRRFSKHSKITLLQGDSGELLQTVLDRTMQPCLFWLDSHYSGGITSHGASNTPILTELQTIASHPYIKDHVIFIDDARCFTGQAGYPLLMVVRQWAAQQGFEIFKVEDDVIRIHNIASCTPI